VSLCEGSQCLHKRPWELLETLEFGLFDVGFLGNECLKRVAEGARQFVGRCFSYKEPNGCTSVTSSGHWWWIILRCRRCYTGVIVGWVRRSFKVWCVCTVNKTQAVAEWLCFWWALLGLTGKLDQNVVTVWNLKICHLLFGSIENFNISPHFSVNCF
jgi:hypothetical protein